MCIRDRILAEPDLRYQRAGSIGPAGAAVTFISHSSSYDNPLRPMVEHAQLVRAHSISRSGHKFRTPLVGFISGSAGAGATESDAIPIDVD